MHTLLHDQAPDVQWQRWFQLCDVNTVDFTSGPRYTSTDIILRAAMSGQGVALVSEVLAADDIAQGRLIQPLPQAIDLGVNYWLVIPERSQSMANVSSFCQWLERQTSPLSQ